MVHNAFTHRFDHDLFQTRNKKNTKTLQSRRRLMVYLIVYFKRKLKYLETEVFFAIAQYL